MDKKKLIGETEHKITQHEIDAWNRGKGDAAASERLAALTSVSVDKAVAIVKLWAELGDYHFVATRFNLDVKEVRQVLSSFNINSIEDAKAAMRNGVIAEYEDEAVANIEKSRAIKQLEDKEAQARLDVVDKQNEVHVKTEAEQDADLAERRTVAQRLNKEDRLRQLIAEGIDPKVNTSDFRIPLGSVGRFTRMIPGGISQLQRQFGGSPKDIINEIERLAPGKYDVDMLRR